jgi:hypothetical protein
MANLTETVEWIEGLYRFEVTDPVLGGEEGIDNVQAKQLGARTRYLKAALESLGTGLAGHEAAGDPHPQYLIEAEANALIAAAVTALVNSSPAALDTLAELAAALGNDANFAATLTGLLAAKAPLASPALTGVPTVPTAAPGTLTTQAASTAFVAAAITAIGLAAYAQLGVAQSWTKGQRGAVAALPATTGNCNFNFDDSINFAGQATGNITFANGYSSAVAGQSGKIRVRQDGATLRNWAFGSNWKYVGGPSQIPAQTQALAAYDEIIYSIDSAAEISFTVRSDVK